MVIPLAGPSSQIEGCWNECARLSRRTRLIRWSVKVPRHGLLLIVVCWWAFNARWLFQPDTSSSSTNPIASSQASDLPRNSQQYVRRNKRGKVVMKEITRVTLADLQMSSAELPVAVKDIPASYELAAAGKEPILSLLRDSGIMDLDTAVVAQLPKWKAVVDLYALDQPVVAVGWETCATYRQAVPPEKALIGTAGMYNTGTNALTYYLRSNLVMPDNKEPGQHDGILTQVPWDKHYFFRQRNNHTAVNSEQYDKSAVLPIVMVRDPLTWMSSTCRQSYDIKWLSPPPSSSPEQSQQQCPNLAATKVQIPTMNADQTWASLATLWSDWYTDYLDSEQPHLIVRFEDLLFRPKEVLDVIRRCTGAAWKDADTFTYVVDRSKWEHARLRPNVPQSNWISAMIQHGHVAGRTRNMTKQDLQEVSGKVLDDALMQAFRYQLPGVA